MSDSTLPSGKVFEQEVRFSLVSGEVVGVDRQTDTHFETTPGSVMAFGNVVSVTAPSISARSHASKRVWVRKEDGTEMSIAAPDNLEARAGHKVAVLLASGMQQGAPKHQWCAIVNYTTGHWNQVDQYPPVNVVSGWLGFWVGIVFYGGPPVLGVMLVVTWIAVWLVRWSLFGGEDFAALVTNFLIACLICLGSTFIGVGRANEAKETYARRIKSAAEAAFQAEQPTQAPAATGVAAG